MPRSTRATIRLLPAVTLAATLSACATSSGAGPSAGAGAAADASTLVERALAAQGGAAAVESLRAISYQATATFWEPEQSLKPGGEPRLAGEGTATVARDLAAGTARLEWVRKYVYPGPREYRYTELVTPGAGAVLGVDTSARTKQSLDSNPPRHAMSGVRLAAAQRELLRASPHLLLEMHANPHRVDRSPDEEAGGRRLPTVSYRASDDVTFLVMFDPATGLPARVRTYDADNVHGDSAYDLVLADWRPVGGVRLAHALRYELGGREVVRIGLDQVRPEAGAAVEIPADLRAAAPRPATGEVPWQWVLRRQHIGIYLDSDQVHFDPQANPQGLRLVELAPGVQHVVGGTHNSLVVELADALAVIDAPIDDRQSRFTIDAAKARYPEKPIRWLVLTHHHMDHVGGARAFVAEGATVVVGPGNAERFRKTLAAPDRLSGGILAGGAHRVEVVEVADRLVLGAGNRTLEAIRADNPHAEGMLIGWVPQARIAFVSDLWSPGREKLGQALTPNQAAIVATVHRTGISPERVAGGHGGVAEYASLEALAR